MKDINTIDPEIVEANEPRYSLVQIEAAIEDVLDTCFVRSEEIGYGDGETSPLDVAERVMQKLKA